MKGDLQSAKALVTVNHTGLHKQDNMMSVLSVCQRQLESELFLVKNDMQLSAEDRARASGTVKVLGPFQGGRAAQAWSQPWPVFSLSFLLQ